MEANKDKETVPLTSISLDCCTINDGVRELFCVGFNRSPAKLFIYSLLGVLSGGFVFLLGYWNPTQRVRFTHRRCSLPLADTVTIESKEGEKSMCKVRVVETDKVYDIGAGKFNAGYTNNDRQYYRILVYNFVRFLWDHKEGTFTKLTGLTNCCDAQTLTDFGSGISEEQRNDLLRIYGPNQIDIPVKSFLRIFLELALNPFYLFQLFSCILWITDDYTILAVFILSVSLIGLLLSTYQTLKRLKDISAMISNSKQVHVLQPASDGSQTVVSLSSERLVPGDVIVLNDAGHVLYDAALVCGACVVNESMLTGESVPIHKTRLGDLESQTVIYSSEEHKRQTIYNGTDILRVIAGPDGTRAIVINTGFSTVKGNLIRNVLNTKPLGFTFFRDSLKFILLIAVIAFCGFLYSVVILVRFNTPIGQIARRALDTITIAISPALPIALTFGTLLAIRQLNLRKIYCTDMPKINSCGKIKLVCFDKTGTLTENDLKLSQVIPSTNGILETPCRASNLDTLINTETGKALSCCHSLTLIDGVVKGEPLDEEIFSHSGCEIKENPRLDEDCSPLCHIVTQSQDVRDVLIWKHYLFDSYLKRMGVLITDEGKQMATVFVKGAPEIVVDLCLPSSIPANYQDYLENLTRLGYRVIAYGKKEQKITDELALGMLMDRTRQEAEKNISFLGFVVMENLLKEETKDVINELKLACIRTVMATGDNLRTGVTVGRQCGIVDSYCPVYEITVDDRGDVKYERFPDINFNDLNSTEDKMEKREDSAGNSGLRLADIGENEKVGHLSSENSVDRDSSQPQLVLTGSEFMKLKEYHADIYEKVLLLAVVYARMTPDQKALLVEDLQSLGLTTCMCGDGANDCMALKAAEISISLSDSEASIAAPFTSNIRNITCVLKLIREGRSALVTSFTCFQFLVLYCMIQFMNVLILYSVNSLLSNNQFLWIDVVYSMTIFMSIIEVRSNPKVAKARPAGKLFHPTFTCSVLGQILIQLTFQLIIFYYVQYMGWYKPPRTFPSRHSTLVKSCYENTVLFSYSSVQYIIVGIISCKGPPFREETHLNVRFSSLCIAQLVLITGMIIHPGRYLQELLNLVGLPYIFTVSLLLIGLANAYCSYLFDEYWIPSHTFKKIYNYVRRKKAPRNRYKHVSLNLMPVSNVTCISI